MPAGEQDVLRLDVAMYHAVPVRVLERVGGLRCDPERRVHGKLLVSIEPVPQRLALDERHREPELPRRFARIVDRQDVRMLQAGGEPDLALEPLRTEGVAEVRMEHLEGDGTVVPEVVRQVHRRHTAPAELALDAVALGEALLELGAQVGHRGPYMERGLTGR